MNGEYWYKYIKEHNPDVLGKDIIDYVEQLKLDKQELEKQLNLHVVSHQRELLAISCLNNIVEPINYLRQLAEVDGGELDGSFAIHLTKQGMFYQELAKKALKEIDNCG